MHNSQVRADRRPAGDDPEHNTRRPVELPQNVRNCAERARPVDMYAACTGGVIACPAARDGAARAPGSCPALGDRTSIGQSHSDSSRGMRSGRPSCSLSGRRPILDAHSRHCGQVLALTTVVLSRLRAIHKNGRVPEPGRKLCLRSPSKSGMHAKSSWCVILRGNAGAGGPRAHEIRAHRLGQASRWGADHGQRVV